MLPFLTRLSTLHPLRRLYPLYRLPGYIGHHSTPHRSLVLSYCLLVTTSTMLDSPRTRPAGG